MEAKILLPALLSLLLGLLGPATTHAQSSCVKHSYTLVPNENCSEEVVYEFDVEIPASATNTVNFENVTPIITAQGGWFRYELDPIMGGVGEGENTLHDARWFEVTKTVPKRIISTQSCGNVMKIKGKVSFIPTSVDWRFNIKYLKSGNPYEFSAISNELNPIYVNTSYKCVAGMGVTSLQAFFFFSRPSSYYWEVLNDEDVWERKDEGTGENLSPTGRGFVYIEIRNAFGLGVKYYRFSYTDQTSTLVHSCPIKVYFTPVICVWP